MIKFSKIFKSFIVVIFAVTLLEAQSVQAAIISPSTASPTVATGSVFLVDINLNTEGQILNTVEGQIELSGITSSYEVVDVLLGGSALNLWPEKPQITKSGALTSLKFTGGSTKGINSTKALLMKLAVSAKSQSSLQITLPTIKAFLHDGSGQTVNVSTNTTNVRIVPSNENDQAQDAVKDLISQDNTPPEPFSIDLGRDQALFGGRYFISFVANDSESGIAYYEVKEGDRSSVRSGSPYVLIDQELHSIVEVTAYDKAGNERTITWKPSMSSLWSKILGKTIVIAGALLILAVLVAIVLLIRKLWNKRKQKSQI